MQAFHHGVNVNGASKGSWSWTRGDSPSSGGTSGNSPASTTEASDSDTRMSPVREEEHLSQETSPSSSERSMSSRVVSEDDLMDSMSERHALERQAKRERVTRRMNKVKLKHRSSLKLEDWGRFQWHLVYKERVAQIVAQLSALPKYSIEVEAEYNAYQATRPLYTDVERVHTRDVSVKHFVERYERPNVPVMIEGIADDWPAMTKWTMEALKTGEYRDVLMRCGEDDDGHSCKVKLKTFLRYVRYNTDDSPLYIFDSAFDEHRVSSGFLHDYRVPKYFRNDLFNLVSEKRRPPYRWVLVGPERSGTCLHIDPLGTSAWNTVIEGHKLWILFKPDAPKKIVKGKPFVKPGEDDEAVDYFLNVVPRILEWDRSQPGGPTLGTQYFIQGPGETVFVPGGWWHAVLNLDDTVAVTQNFCSMVNFPRVWVRARKGRKHMSRRWLEKLKIEYPTIYQTALELNERDGFEWKFSKKKKKKKKSSKQKASADGDVVMADA